MQNEYKPATNLRDAYNACHPDRPLEPDDPRYVELSEHRGGFNLVGRLLWNIVNSSPTDYLKQLVSGHRGSGKTTELKRLQRKLEDNGFIVVYIDVGETLDLGDIRYTDILLAITKGIFEATQDLGVDEGLLKNIVRWFAEETEVETVEKSESAKAGAEAKVGITTIFLKLIGKTMLDIKMASGRRREIRQKVERNLGDFIDSINELIRDAQHRAAQKGKNGLVVIVDTLEKMVFHRFENGHTSYEDLFVHHADQLKAPECHVIYTVPIWLAYNTSLWNLFPNAPEVMPMVKVRHRNGEPNHSAISALFELVQKRVDIDRIFESGDIVFDFIELSGGSVRDLLRLIREACTEAGTAGESRITKWAARKAEIKLINDYDRLIRSRDIEKLIRIAKEKPAPEIENDAYLLDTRLIMEYMNDERWSDVHPAVKRNPRLRDRFKDIP